MGRRGVEISCHSKRYGLKSLSLTYRKVPPPSALLGDVSDHTGLGVLHHVRTALHLTVKSLPRAQSTTYSLFQLTKHFQVCSFSSTNKAMKVLSIFINEIIEARQGKGTFFRIWNFCIVQYDSY